VPHAVSFMRMSGRRWFRTDIEVRGHGSRKLLCTITAESELAAHVSHHYDTRNPTEFAPHISDVSATYVN
jgi:hypothetical protein